jgi:hypothetical protein
VAENSQGSVAVLGQLVAYYVVACPDDKGKAVVGIANNHSAEEGSMADVAHGSLED